MDKYKNIIDAFFDNDVLEMDRVLGLLKYTTHIKQIYQTNFIDLIEKKTNIFFFKLFVKENDKWEFFDYGWLKNYNFYSLRTGSIIFNINKKNYKILRHMDSDNHGIIFTNDKSYLIYNICIPVVRKIFNLY